MAHHPGGGEGEDDSDEHPDARGDIGTDDDEVLETDEEEEEEEDEGMEDDHGWAVVPCCHDLMTNLIS
jgi:hypothetical protein